MNRYYTDSVPYDLAEALKEKGMPIETEGENIWCPSYAECFDWLMSKGVCICMTCTRRAFRMALGYGYVVQTLDKFFASESNSRTWEKSAILAIGKALELI